MKTITQTLSAINAENRIGLMTHVVVGYPTLEDTYELIKTMAEVGIDAIELQIPFSDPLGDGSTIVHANEVALQNGITPSECMLFMQRVSQEFSISFLFMTYGNIVFQYGTQNFVNDAKAFGASGLIIPDAMPDNYEGLELYNSARDTGLPVVTVVAPHNSKNRLNFLKESLNVLVYLPAHQGVTGAREDSSSNLEIEIETLRKYTSAAIAVGFGISTPVHVQAVQDAGADIAVIGSAVIDVFNLEGIRGVKNLLQNIINATR